ncbi:MAG TPA: sugar phosphate nucleotidyltransferase [Gaiellaceae bacterium]|nr:sugar phosphate nucleotidyltransferase [Gaiellaceae bacterium]
MQPSGVVLAAGEGRRLRPLTERWPKPVLPIDGRPVIASLLLELRTAGLTEVTVVVGHLAEQVEHLLGDGSGFGLSIRYARQPAPDGSADAVRRALEAGAEPPLLVVGADTVFTRGDIQTAASAWLASGASGGLGVRPVPPAELGRRAPVRASGGLVTALGGEADDRAGARKLAAAPLWFLNHRFAGCLEGLPGPPYELAEAGRRLLEAGETILALELGPTRDITHPEDVVRHNFPYLR